MLNGEIPHHFEDSIPVQSGSLHIHLLGPGTGPGTVPGPILVDGEFEGECAFAIWKPETLELGIRAKRYRAETALLARFG